MTATERFKVRLANAIETICVLEEQLEAALAQVEALQEELARSREVAADEVEDSRVGVS